MFKRIGQALKRGKKANKPTLKGKKRPLLPIRSGKRSYEMAELDCTLGWKDVDLSSNQTLAASFSIIKSRAHQLARENAHIRSFLTVSTTNIVGSNGFPFQSKLKASKGPSSGKFDKDFNDNFERIKKQMAKSHNCYTADRKLSEKMLDAFIWKLFCIDGEAIILHMPTNKNKFGITKKLIDPCLLDHNLNGWLSNGNYVKMGIEVDQDNMPLAYHFRTQNDKDLIFSGFEKDFHYQHERVEAQFITHLFIPEYVGQIRGISMFVASGLRAHMISLFEKSTVISATVAMAKGHFYKLNHEAAENAGVLGGMGEDGEENGNINEDQADLVQTVTPAQGEVLPSYVEDVFTLDHSFPPANYEEFSRVNLKTMAAGLPIQYHALTGDYSEVNFSSARMAEIEQRPIWRTFQNFMKEEWKEPALIKEAEILVISMYDELDTEKVARCVEMGFFHFGSRGWDYTNPLDAAKANQINLMLGLTSRRRITQETHGDMDFEEHLDELAEEIKLMDSKGLNTELTDKKDTTEEISQAEEDLTNGKK